MAKLLVVFLSLLLAFHVCFAWSDYSSVRIEAEAGFTDLWDNDIFSYAGGNKAIRHTIQPKGLLLPFYSENDKVAYIVQGTGVMGIVLPWCVEKCQTKIIRIRAADVVAIPAGVTSWLFNDGNQPITIISLSTTGNDKSFTYFYLAGNPLAKMANMSTGEINNIFNGFDNQLLSESLRLETRIIKSLQGQNDTRGNIVYTSDSICVDNVEQEPIIIQEISDELLVEEEICTMKLKENIVDHPDLKFSGGYTMTIDKKALPILGTMHISVKRGAIYQNAYIGPMWVVNAISVVYFTKGSGRIQLVDNRGKSVFDGEVKKDQIWVVPHNFVGLAKASKKGLEWIEFVANDYAIFSQISQVFKYMPVEVLMSSYQISRDDAIKLRSVSSSYSA